MPTMVSSRNGHVKWRQLAIAAAGGALLGLLAAPAPAQDAFAGARAQLLREIEEDVRRTAEYLKRAALRDEVLDAMRAVPRHRFVPPAEVGRAYLNRPLPIGHGQTISQPYIVAIMTDLLDVASGGRVLEIGTGSGYQAAVLARLAARVVSIERIPRLAAQARRALDRLGITNVVVHLGDGSLGRPADAPFDAIVVTAAGPDIPPPLLAQLGPGGRLVGPFGAREGQRLLRVRRLADGRVVREVLGDCRFVDLIGAHGRPR